MRMDDHKCPDDPFAPLFDQTRDDDDGEGAYQVGCWGLDCLPQVEFDWDQWMRCSIRCLHGAVAAVSCGINFMESFQNAVTLFNAYDHTRPVRPQLKDEPFGDYFDRAMRGPYDPVENV